jgi:hypothetical protein
MSEEKDLSNQNVTPVKTYMDMPYPRKIWDDIRNGRPVDFQELVKTGMVISYLVFDEKEVLAILDSMKKWATEVNSHLAHFVDFDEEQKALNRFLEINKNSDRVDQLGLNKLFEKVCLCSQLSEHMDEDNPTLITSDTLIVTFGSSNIKWYYVAISSLPDLIEDERLKQFADESLGRLKMNLRKLKKGESSKPPVINQDYHINIQNVSNSNFQLGTSNSIQNLTIQQNDLSAIIELISKLENSIDKLLISQAQKENLLANIETIKAQTKSSKPTKQIVVDALGSLRDILEALPAGQIIVTEIVSNLAHILKSLGIG